MTIGHLLESILAKGAAISGEKVDATMFEDPNISNSQEILEKMGYEKNGEEVLYSPSTGMPLEASIFIAPIYYQRLKHMSQDKVKARQSGRMSSITRQPTGTSGSEKPLKIGEMEASGILAHGMSTFFYESSMEKSDSMNIWTDRSGETIAYNEKQDKFLGIVNKNETNFTKHKIPFAMNVLKHETEALGIGIVFEK
jgi:DNA-directed RNA polymerase II subunit RPB2